MAILLVVLNHLWPARVTGGYVGVDVFFVISGFLITGHLVTEQMERGRIALGAFYARRVRRLLPAAFLVLLITAIAAFLLLPYPRWVRTGGEILASAGYVENWFLSAMSVNYSALNEQATPVQHYWSLSVEEQFYLVWPLVLIAAWWWASRRSAHPRRVAAVALAVLVTVSLALSVVVTISLPGPAYFVTYARVWEFGIGGLVALLVTRRLPRAAAESLAIAGFIAIAVAAAFYGPSTPFPSATALLPALGTAAVIVAGTGRSRLLHGAATSLRPVQWLGDISYSLYLWHWPLIVLMPFLLGGELSTLRKIGVLAVALGLAWLTRRFVEVPGQSWKPLRRSTPVSLIGMVAGMLVVAVPAGLLLTVGTAKVEAEHPPASVQIAACHGPQALDPSAACPDRFGPADEPVMSSRNAYFSSPPECAVVPGGVAFGAAPATAACDFSGGAPDPVRVWIVGDSHAEQWKGAILDIARRKGWSVTWSFGGGCPVNDAPYIGFRTPSSPADRDRCRSWSTKVTDQVLKEAPDLVFTSSAGRAQLVDDGTGRPQPEQFVDGLTRTWSIWADAGIVVVPLGGVPFNAEVRDPGCALLHEARPVECAVPEEKANPADPYLVAAARMANDRVRPFDASRFFCAEGLCYAVVGGIVVYYDADHLNLDYVRRLAPALEKVLPRMPD